MERKRIKCALPGPMLCKTPKSLLNMPAKSESGERLQANLHTCLRETSAPNGDSAREYSRANYVFFRQPK